MSVPLKADGTGRTFILNGSKAGKAQLRQMKKGLNDRAVRTEKGGYLIKAAVVDDRFYFGIIPFFHQGQRNHHYDIEMPDAAHYILVGSLNPEGEFSILFIPDAVPLSRRTKSEYAIQYRVLAEELLSLGVDGTSPLDGVTRGLLNESGVMEDPPETLERLIDYQVPKSS